MKRFAVIALLALSACANVQVTPLNAPPAALQPKSADQVEVFLTKKPASAYTEVYMIRSDAGDSKQALRAMRKEAGALGCDAIIITGNADRVVAAPDASGNATISMREGFLGSCVVYDR